LTEILRRHAEDEYAAELAADGDRPRPPGWRLQAAKRLAPAGARVRFGNSPYVGRYWSRLTRVAHGAWSAQFREDNSGAGGEGLLASMYCR
jgi:hypothetical protein